MTDGAETVIEAESLPASDASTKDSPAKDRPLTPLERNARQLRVAFLATLAVGAFLLWVWPDHWWPPVLLMVVYFLLGRNLSRSAKNSSMLADSIYYQGFLFTLIALMLSTIGSDSAASAALVLGRFSTALTTTIVGIGLRIWLIQFDVSISDQDKEVRSSLSQWADRLEQELAGVHAVLARSRTQVEADIEHSGQALKQGKETLASVHKSMTGHVDSLAEMIVDYQNRLGKLDPQKEFQLVTTRLIEITTALENHQTDIATRIGDTLTTSMAPIAQKLREVEIPSSLFKEPTEQAFRPLQQHLQNLGSSFANNETKLNGFGEKLTALNEQLGGLTKSIREGTNAATELQATSGSLTRMIGNLTSASESMINLQRSAVASLDAIAKTASEVQKIADVDIGARDQRLRQSAARIEEQIQNAHQEIGRLEQVIQMTQDGVSEAVKALRALVESRI